MIKAAGHIDRIRWGALLPQRRRTMPAIIDTAARPPTPDAIKAARHKGQVVYISPARTGGGLI